MALIDVSELLIDPDFVDPVLVIRTTSVMGQDGRSVDTQESFPGILMSVQPAAGKTLMTLPEAARMEGVYEVWTQFELMGPKEGTQADRIVWKGRHLIVEKLDDFDNYGQGYFHAICCLEGVVG